MSENVTSDAATNSGGKFTPGPWHIDWNRGMAPRIIGVYAPGQTREIADVRFHNGSDDPHVHANARLIAAAPETAAERDRLKALNADLLTALRNMTALANNMRETIEGGNFVTRYEIPFGYFNAAYVAMEQAESLTRT